MNAIVADSLPAVATKFLGGAGVHVAAFVAGLGRPVPARLELPQ